jgi:hypothetical protein
VPLSVLVMLAKHLLQKYDIWLKRRDGCPDSREDKVPISKTKSLMDIVRKNL